MFWATLDSFCDTGAVIAGRAVANREFLSALLGSGLFQEYHFFLGDSHAVKHFQTSHSWIFENRQLTQQVRLFKRPELLTKLNEIDYTVFHQSDFVTYYPSLCHLRNDYSKFPFPITGTTHSLSYQRFMSSYLQLLLGGVQSFDSILSTSQSGKQALVHSFHQISRCMKEQHKIQLRFQGRLDHVPLGVDHKKFQRQEKAKARHTLGLPQDRLVLLSVSRFCEFSKADLFPLLKAFQMLVKEQAGEGIVLLLAGASRGSGYIEEIQKYAESLGVGDLVYYKADFPDEEKPFLFQAADIFVSLIDNFQETFGLSVVEAMASGLPVVVSDFDGYQELVEHGKDGFKVPTYWGPGVDEISALAPIAFERPYHLHLAQSVAVDIEIAAGFLHDLMMNPNRRKRMGEAARTKVQREYDWNVVIQKYGEIWNTLKQEASNNKKLPPSLNPSPHQGGRGALLPARHGGGGKWGLEACPDNPSNPLHLNYYEAFRHYSSDHLEETWKVEMTDFGGEVYYQRKTQGVYEDLWDLISLKSMRHILFLCKQGKNTGCLISRVIQEVSKKQGISNSRVYFHLLWMLKHNLLRVRP